MRLVQNGTLCIVHLHDVEPTLFPIPVEDALDPCPPTPLEAAPARRRAAHRPVLREPRDVDVRAVHPRVAPPSVPSLSQLPTTTARTRRWPRAFAPAALTAATAPLSTPTSRSVRRAGALRRTASAALARRRGAMMMTRRLIRRALKATTQDPRTLLSVLLLFVVLVVRPARVCSVERAARSLELAS